MDLALATSDMTSSIGIPAAGPFLLKTAIVPSERPTQTSTKKSFGKTEKMREHPEEWQAEVAAFLPDADKTVAKATKNDLKSYAQSYNVAENFDQQVDRSEDLIFNRRHYLRHFKKWEHSDDETYVEEGNKSFNKMHEDQEGAEDDSTEFHIAVPNPKKKRVRDTGTRTSTGSRMQGQISDESHQAFFNRTNRKMGMSPSTEVPEDAADEPPRKKARAEASMSGELRNPGTTKAENGCPSTLKVEPAPSPKVSVERTGSQKSVRSDTMASQKPLNEKEKMGKGGQSWSLNRSTSQALRNGRRTILSLRRSC